MIGFIVKNAAYGVGRVETAKPGRVSVRFFQSDSSLEFAVQKFPIGLSRFILGLGTECETDGKICCIKKREPGSGWTEPNVYIVEFADGRLDELAETALTPTQPAPNLASAFEALSQLQHESYGVFACRETLTRAYLQTVRSAAGVRALLSSRIDLRPHQAYVAGVVMLDYRQRYLLADEVGLGKTIEAGIIVHDLLLQKPNARILIMCPGSLVQQWFCELYSKFCGRVFRLPELTNAELGSGMAGVQVVLSFFGAKARSEQLLASPWDLVVVDEVHHLLAAPALYNLAKDLSRSARGLLLLSALPARHQEDEYLRLLALLEPDRYHPERDAEVIDFREIYARQRYLGTVLGWASRKLPEVAAGERTSESILIKLRELTTWPILEKDEKLKSLIAGMESFPESFTDQVRTVLHHVGDTYRINRRILRNRRSRLIEQDEIPQIERRFNPLSYRADQFELDALEFVHRLLIQLQRDKLDEGVLMPLARLLLQATVDPHVLGEVLRLADEANRLPIAQSDCETFVLDSLAGYVAWHSRVITLWRSAQLVLSKETLADASASANKWRDVEESRARFDTLTHFLKRQHQSNPRAKFLVFAGAPGLAQRLHEQVSLEFHGTPVGKFHFGLTDLRKEEEVRWFRRDEKRWILISDETGGEGRNFQFVDELIHFDTPWHAAQVEQRIGRLDRLGRERSDVTSHVLFCNGTEEEGLVACFENGLEIYTRSISGLEFALRELERNMTFVAISEGRDGLIAMTPELKAAAAAQRAEDESAEVLDEASYERIVAAGFRKVQSRRSKEQSLEYAFAEYFKSIATSRAVHFRSEPDYPEGIVSFQPEDVRDIPLHFLRDGAGQLPEQRGTFYRKIAQERPDLEFFSVGNAFFDAICNSLFTAAKGCTYAIECQLPATEWRGFEFTFRVTGGEKRLLNHPGLLNLWNRLFAGGLEHVWVREDGEQLASGDQLLKLRRSLNSAGKNHTWWNLTGNKAQALEERYAVPGWSMLLKERMEQARLWARGRFREMFAERLLVEHGRLNEQQRQLANLHPTGWENDSTAIELLRQALNEWDVELDSLGFLSVNGGLLRR